MPGAFCPKMTISRPKAKFKNFLRALLTHVGLVPNYAALSLDLVEC